MINFNQFSQAASIDIGTVKTIDFENLTSPRGNLVPNQFSVFIGGTSGTLKVFKSYASLIAIKYNGNLIFDRSKWDYSPTTLRYLKQFLGTSKSKRELVEMINNGEIILADLN